MLEIIIVKAVFFIPCDERGGPNQRFCKPSRLKYAKIVTS